jgi:ABC-type multidrug transport system ATPase subunit
MIQIEAISKSYNYNKLFEDFSATYQYGNIYGIAGRNGSGKSTLLKMISNFITPSTGKISYFDTTGNEIKLDDVYKCISYTAPYIEPYTEATLEEAILFHFSVKKLHENTTIEALLATLNIDKQKRVQSFSTGMLQRLKLILAICTDTPFLLIDEPTETLDAQGKQWFQELLNTFAENRIVLIASNNPNDFESCIEVKNIEDFKK